MNCSVQISHQQIVDQLITAREGGINYWCDEFAITKDGQPLPFMQLLDKPELLPNCLFEVREEENGKIHKIDYNQIIRGLEVMSQDYIRHFGDLFTDNGDATTADVFMQCAVFGELVYG